MKASITDVSGCLISPVSNFFNILCIQSIFIFVSHKCCFWYGRDTSHWFISYICCLFLSVKLFSSNLMFFQRSDLKELRPNPSSHLGWPVGSTSAFVDRLSIFSVPCPCSYISCWDFICLNDSQIFIRDTLSLIEFYVLKDGYVWQIDMYQSTILTNKGSSFKVLQINIIGHDFNEIKSLQVLPERVARNQVSEATGIHMFYNVYNVSFLINSHDKFFCRIRYFMERSHTLT